MYLPLMFSDLREEETDGGAENAVEVEEQVEEEEGRLVLSRVQGDEGALDSAGRNSTSRLTEEGGAESVVMASTARPRQWARNWWSLWPATSPALRQNSSL